jgi:hypothetical protein
MLKFAYHDEIDTPDGPNRPLAYLVGKDQMSAPATIRLEEGVLVCEPSGDDAAALAIQVDAGRAGRLTLQTCLLPARDEAYLLPLELARHRVMLFLNCLEDWGLSDLPGEHPAMRRFEEARRLFTKALVQQNDSEELYTREQAQLAREALVAAIDASEVLTLSNAQRELSGRYEAAGASDLSNDPDKPRLPMPATIGCTVHNAQFAEPLQKILKSNFDFISCPMRWDEMEPEEGTYNFTPTDRWIEWAVRKAKMPVVAGPVIDLSSRAVPEWLYIWEHDYRTLREFVYEHVKRVVTRYRKTVSRWTVIAGANVNSEFALSLEEMVDLTRLSVLLVRKLQPKAQVIVEIAQPFGEHGTHIERSISPRLYAEVIKEAGIRIDGLALRLQFGDTEPGRTCRDLMQIACAIDSYAGLDQPLHISAFGAPSHPVRAAAREATKGSAAHGGSWKAAWSPRIQAEWIKRALTVVLAKPQVKSVCWQNLYDTSTNRGMRYGGLISEQGKAKPALRTINEIAAEHRAGVIPSPLADSVVDLTDSAIASAIQE